MINIIDERNYINGKIEYITSEIETIKTLFGYEAPKELLKDLKELNKRLDHIKSVEKTYNQCLELLSSGVPNLTRYKYDRYCIPVFIFDNPTSKNNEEKYVIEIRTVTSDIQSDYRIWTILTFIQKNNNRDTGAFIPEVIAISCDGESLMRVDNRYCNDTINIVFEKLIDWLIDNKFFPMCVENYKTSHPHDQSRTDFKFLKSNVWISDTSSCLDWLARRINPRKFEYSIPDEEIDQSFSENSSSTTEEV